MRVLFIHPAYPNQFTAIAHAMADIQGIEPAFLTDGAHMDQIENDQAPIPYFPYTFNGDNGQSPWYIRCYDEGLRHGKGVCDAISTIMADFQPDVVIGHASFGTTFYLRDMFNIPVISYVELPGYHMAWCREEYPALDEHRFLNTAFQSLVFASAMNSDAVIVPSRHAGNYFPPELQAKIRVQMEGFSLPPLYPDKGRLRQKNGLPEHGPIVGFASRTLEAMRGFDIFLRVAKRLKKKQPDLHFLVVGSEQTLYGNELAYLGGKSFKQHALEELNLDDDFFIWRDYLEYDRFHEHLQAMDLILFPLFEGAANWGLFEAMASGLTVVASDRCFVPEVIVHGQDGFMFDPYAVEAMADQCLAILSDPSPYSSIAENVRKKIRDCYSVENSVNGYIDVISEVVLTKDKKSAALPEQCCMTP